MVIDSSSLMSVVLGEDDAYLYADAIIKAQESRTKLYLPASVLVEAGITAEQRRGNDVLDLWLRRLQAEVVPLDRFIAELARNAFRRFGWGQHPAKLNFGDCMSYATAQYLKLPLLYKGNDFPKTDIQSALKVN